jgi:hypothetical protein
MAFWRKKPVVPQTMGFFGDIVGGAAEAGSEWVGSVGSWISGGLGRVGGAISETAKALLVPVLIGATAIGGTIVAVKLATPGRR